MVEEKVVKTPRARPPKAPGTEVIQVQQQGGAVTPAALLQLAVQQGADLDKMKQLMDLQERWEANEARKAFVAALTAFKANPPALSKNKHVSFKTDRGVTEYDHATLDQVSDVIGKGLSQHGLSHRWDVKQEGGRIIVVCILTHVLGHSERVQMESAADTSGGKNSIQAIGSSVAYLQRYTLLAAAGMAAKGQDVDGRAVERLEESVFTDFVTAIEGAVDADNLEQVWKSAVAACKKAGDTDAYNELKAKVTAKGKQLKGKK
jgi:hypothetical protein